MQVRQLSTNLSEFPFFTPVKLVRDGKKRLIHAPNDAMRELHERLVRHLRLCRTYPFVNAVGGVPRKNIFDHILPHRRKRHCIVLDFRDAYGHVDGRRLALILSRGPYSLGSEEEVLGCLASYFLTDRKRLRGLFQGGPASPDLFNAFCEEHVDLPIRDLLAKWNHAYDLSYTRFIDDLVISSDRPFPGKLVQDVRAIMLRAGFKENQKKTRRHDIQDGPLRIAGLNLHENGDVSLSRKEVSSLRATIRAVVKSPQFRRHKEYPRLLGRVAYFNSVMQHRTRSTKEEQEVQQLIEKWQIA